MDKGTKIIIILAAIGLLLMLISLGHDLFSSKSTSHSAEACFKSAQVQVLKY